MTIDAIPTLQEELDRKTVEALHDIAWRAEHHGLTRPMVELAARTVWTVTAGLVANDISAAAAELAGHQQFPPLQRHFVGQGKVVSMVWNTTGSNFALVQRPAADPAAKSVVPQRYVTVEQRNYAMTKLAEGLTQRGYLEL